VRQSALAGRQVALLLEGCVALMLIHGSADDATAAARAARHLVSLRYAKDHLLERQDGFWPGSGMAGSGECS